MKLYIIVILLLVVPAVYSLPYSILECKPIMKVSDIVNNCTVTSSWNYTLPCESHRATVINSSREVIGLIPFQNYTADGYCFFLWNISEIGSYKFIVDNGDSGTIIIEGDKQMIGFGIMIFLIVFNIGIFVLPIFAKTFTHSKAMDYVVRNIIYMSGILFLWFNMTIFRQMAVDAGLGIDNQLLGYWWFFTIAVCCVILIMIYTTAKGYVNMMDEIRMQMRMGDYAE